MAEWPRGVAEPTKFWLSNLPAETRIGELVRLSKRRWMVGRDHLELKQELGLEHFEGRSWLGFSHHHAALCIAAYGFLVAERSPPRPRAGRSSRGSLRVLRSSITGSSCAGVSATMCGMRAILH